MNRFVVRMFFALALWSPALALAEDCSKIADEAARLACFDKASPSAKNSKGTQTASKRCQGITKKGAQCKRNAKPGSDYCWQHGT